MKRTNIMLSEDQHEKLKSYAKSEGRTIGKLVREAVDSTYKKKDAVEERKRIALGAYREGFISLGKLAEILGLDPITARSYLKDQGIPLHVADPEDHAQDNSNA
jgi:predicted HTH domain antitoxin